MLNHQLRYQLFSIIFTKFSLFILYENNNPQHYIKEIQKFYKIYGVFHFCFKRSILNNKYINYFF